MLIETKNRIDEVVAGLKVGNTLFDNHIYIFDPTKESLDSFDGLTDQIADYVYLEKVQSDDVLFPDPQQPTNNWARSDWKLIGRTSTYTSSDLLEFCVNRVQKVGGCNVTNLTCDSERIYFEETGGELRDEMHIIRIGFTVSSLVTWCAKTYNLCLNKDCS
jgi:hypothetical protein